MKLILALFTMAVVNSGIQRLKLKFDGSACGRIAF